MLVQERNLEKVEVEILTPTVNAVVLRVPGRKFPAIALQGDTLHTLLTGAQRARERLAGGDVAEAADELAWLEERLMGFLRVYEETLAAHGIRLPYVR